MPRDSHSVIFFDGRVDHPQAPAIRKRISEYHRAIGEAHAKMRPHKAAEHGRALVAFEQANRHLLQGIWPTAKSRQGRR